MIEKKEELGLADNNPKVANFEANRKEQLDLIAAEVADFEKLAVFLNNQKSR